jgi:hypothetical protein
LLITVSLQIVKQIDRFLYFTLSHALMEFENKRPYHDLPMEAGVIAGPLKVLLDRPDRYIIQRLKVLEARYNHYKIGPDIARGRAFDVRTDFFTAVTDQSAATMAWKMTQDVLREFANLNINEIMLNGDHLRRLALKWDQLYHDTLEVATAGGLDGKLRDIAKVIIYTFPFLPSDSTSSLKLGALHDEESFLSMCHFKWNAASTTSGGEQLGWFHRCEGQSSPVPASATCRPFTSVHIPFHRRTEKGTT